MKPSTWILACMCLSASAVVFSGCHGKEDDAKAKEEDNALERRAKAAEIYVASTKEPPSRKIELLRKLVGFYPESEYASRGYFDLAFYLLDQHPDDPGQALEAAKAFGERHPDDASASESFRLIDSHAGTRDMNELRAKAQEAWASFLERARELTKSKPADVRARWLIESGDCARRRRDPERAAAFLEEALALDIPAKDEQMRALLLLGEVQGKDLGRKEDGVKTYQKALVLARAGVVGATEQTIQAAIDSLN